MYRLLIVDDEVLVANGLSELISIQTELDLDIYKAYSGRDALDWLDRTRMDVVLTDIRMPELDGMQLLTEIRRRWPQCRVIFLTGYSEFEYVYRAIQDPYASYVLKTEDPMKVIQTVAGVVEAIQREIHIEDLLHEAKEQVRQTHVLYQQDFFRQLLHSRRAVTRELFEELGVPLRADVPLLLTLCRAEELPEDYMEAMRRMQSIRQLLARYIAPSLSFFILFSGGDQIALFAQPSPIQTGADGAAMSEKVLRKAIAFLAGTLEAVQAACRDTLGMPVSFVIASDACSWDDIPNEYAQLNQLLSYRIGVGVETFLSGSERNDRLRNDQAVVPERGGEHDLRRTLGRKDLSEMEKLLMAGRGDSFLALLSDYLDPLSAVTSRNDPLALEAYYTVALALLSYINRWGAMEKVAFHLAQYKLMRPDLFGTWTEAADYLRELARLLLKLQGEEQYRRADKTISYLQAFIREHLSEDLSLIRLSEQVRLNPSYLSRLYRQTTGVTLSDFIDHERIALAKELLSGAYVHVQDVAQQTGYESAMSFTRFFKKNTGRSPQEYRQGQS